ncbi:7679_t:CDS:2 [Entrophospora sp. SA101]|nr:7679_t:CDS:2 [Entrophospora sp. SA101]CAJ0830620.1 6971_t:CDS:2 [Entrophospora sp. SA101]CAJ0845627.1 13074_t:CDS:2 [Entrophospora sp. SA101]
MGYCINNSSEKKDNGSAWHIEYGCGEAGKIFEVNNGYENAGE